MMFGQGLSLNAIQAAGVFQTIANDGVRVPPSLVAGSREPRRQLHRRPGAQRVRVVVARTSPSRCARCSRASSARTAPRPRREIPGYRVAGKTGTADRYDDKTGGYSGKTASFIGFAPADKPELVVGVTLQRPVKSYFGGVVAGAGVPRRHDLRAAGAEDPADRRHDAAHHQAQDHGAVTSPW